MAFPNDGSEPDKAYFDVAGNRPRHVLFCDMPAHQTEWLNGVCIPVDDASMAALVKRELRYDLVDITERVSSYSPRQHFSPVYAFIGRPKFTAPHDVADGVLQRDYFDTVCDGARYWELTSPGFFEDFQATTELPSPERIQALRRVDSPG